MLKLIAKVNTGKLAGDVGKFSMLQFFLLSSWAIYGAYSVYYLTDIGYTNMEIGTVMSVRTFMSIIGPAVVGYLCDRLKNRKNIFILGMIILGVVVVPFPIYNKLFILIFTGLIGFIWSPQVSILDSWIMETSGKVADNYGFARAWGSLGFALFVTIFGKVIEVFGWRVHFIGYGVVVFVTVIIAFFIKDYSYIENSDQENNNQVGQEDNNSISLLFKNFNYVFILVATVLIFVPIQIIFIYLAPIIKSVGGNSEHLGYALFFTALSEAPIFFLAKYFLEKFKFKQLLMISSVFYLIRIIIAAAAVSPVYFIFFGLLQSLSYGVFLITIRYYISIIAPAGLKTTAQSIVLMCAFGLGGIIASLLGGYLIDIYGMAVMFKTCIILASLAVMLLLISMIIDKFRS